MIKKDISHYNILRLNDITIYDINSNPIFLSHIITVSKTDPNKTVTKSMSAMKYTLQRMMSGTKIPFYYILFRDSTLFGNPSTNERYYKIISNRY